MKVEDGQFQSANPILPVRDVKEAAKFYREQLGFSIDVIWENPHYACVSRGGVTIEFGEGRPEHVGSGICYIHVTDVDAVYEELIARRVIHVGALQTRDYGNKDFRVKDNDGNLLIFGSPLINKEELIARRNVAPITR